MRGDAGCERTVFWTGLVGHCGVMVLPRIFRPLRADEVIGACPAGCVAVGCWDPGVSS